MLRSKADIKNRIEEWAKTLMVPQDRLDGMPVCPFAKKAMANNEVEIEEFDEKEEESIYWQVSYCIDHWKSKKNKKLLIFSVPIKYSYTYLYAISGFLMDKYTELGSDLAIIVGHPDRPTVINGITTTFPDCPLLFVQHKDYLRDASDSLKGTGYYRFWTKQQLDEILNWR